MALSVTMDFTVVEQAVSSPIPGYIITLQRQDGFPLFTFTGQDRNACITGMQQVSPQLGLVVAGS